MANEILTPKFGKKESVRVAPYDERGKAKNDLARKVLPYASQIVEVMSCVPYEMRRNVVLVYRVRAEDGKVLEISEDCLMPVKDRI